MSQEHYNVTGTLQCHRYITMSQVHYNVTGTLQCHRYITMSQARVSPSSVIESEALIIQQNVFSEGVALPYNPSSP